jgi:hypothetical protein
MRPVALATLAAGLVVAGPAAAAPPIALSASPTQLVLAGSSRGTITVVNAGPTSVRLAASTGKYTISRDGRVRVGRPSRNSAVKWLSVAPKAVDLASDEKAEISVTSHVPPNATPGDAHALVLLTTERIGGSSVGIRTRLGVGVLVRVGGTFRRRLAITGANVAGRALRIGLANRGNVNERFRRGQISVLLRQRERTVARLLAGPRNLLPRTRGYIEVRAPGSVRGRVRAFVTVRPTSARKAGPGMPKARAVTRRFVLTIQKPKGGTR